MGLGLAIKRTAHFYTPPFRRWVARSVPFLFFWLIAVSTGLYYGPVDMNLTSIGTLIGFAVLWLLRLWAGDPPRAEQPR